MTANQQVWAIVREHAGTAAELLAAFTIRSDANSAAAELGEGHHVAPCPLVPPGTPVRVMHTWQCRATVADGVITVVEEPARLAGASRLSLNAEPTAERVHVDEGAGDLEAAVHGRTVAYVSAYAAGADRARELAVARAEALAQEQRHP